MPVNSITSKDLIPWIKRYLKSNEIKDADRFTVISDETGIVIKKEGSPDLGLSDDLKILEKLSGLVKVGRPVDIEAILETRGFE